MQYYSKSRKSPFVLRYFRGPFGIVDAYLTPLNGPPYGVSTGRCLFVIFPLRLVLASQREPRGESDPGKKGQMRAQRAPSPSRDRAHVRAARNHKSDTSILRRERIEHIEREFKTIQGLIRRRHRRRRVVSFLTGKTCCVHHRCTMRICNAVSAAAVAQPFSSFSQSTPGARLKLPAS